MKKKKKILTIVCCAVLALLLIGGGVTYSFLPHPLNYKIRGIAQVGNSLAVQDKTADSVTVRQETDGDFKVLMFTDMHLDGKNKTSNLTVSHLVENIQKEKPDLMLLGGDNVTSGMNRKRCHQLAQIFEKLDVYWAGVIGNHEGDNPYSIRRSEMMDIFTSYDHCLMRKGLDDVTGDCNYALHILKPDGGMLETFFFLDTFDEVDAERKAQYGLDPDKTAYDGVREDQVQWYTEKVQTTREVYGEYKSIMLVHIPLPQVAEAAAKGDFLYGEQRENVCCTAYEPGLFAAVKASGSTQAVFCGHDHLNNFGAVYDGIVLSYIEPSGYGSYTAASRLGYEEKDWLQGYTVLTLHADGSYDHAFHRNSEG